MNQLYQKITHLAISTAILLPLMSGELLADPPDGYYDSADGLIETALQQALHNIIDNHNVVSYSSLWTHFQSTDSKTDSIVWDMYSDVPGGTPPYEFIFGDDQDIGLGGTTEGDVYNREHSWPRSWFNDYTPMNSDLFHIYPTDKYVNNRRGNYPYGEVGSATWTSQNGSKLGSCSYPGYAGTVFEPIDEYKGDFARTYFYMSVRYYNEDSGWDNTPMTNGAQLDPWALTMLMEWHAQDSVSQKELDRNDTVFTIQNNRNPFIDRPEFVDNIWGDPVAVDQTILDLPASFSISKPYPNPFNPEIHFVVTINQSTSIGIEIFNIAGRIVTSIENSNLSPGTYSYNWDGYLQTGQIAPSGIYFIVISNEVKSTARKILLVR